MKDQTTTDLLKVRQDNLDLRDQVLIVKDNHARLKKELEEYKTKFDQNIADEKKKFEDNTKQMSTDLAEAKEKIERLYIDTVIARSSTVPICFRNWEVETFLDGGFGSQSKVVSVIRGHSTLTYNIADVGTKAYAHERMRENNYQYWNLHLWYAFDTACCVFRNRATGKYLSLIDNVVVMIDLLKTGYEGDDRQIWNVTRELPARYRFQNKATQQYLAVTTSDTSNNPLRMVEDPSSMKCVWLDYGDSSRRVFWQ